MAFDFVFSLLSLKIAKLRIIEAFSKFFVSKSFINIWSINNKSHYVPHIIPILFFIFSFLLLLFYIPNMKYCYFFAIE